MFWDIIIVACLVLISSFFVMVEAAFLSVRRTRIDQLVEEGNRAAKLVAEMLAHPTRLLATLQVGLTLVQLFSAGEATSRFVAPFSQWLERQFPGTLLATAAHGIAFVVTISTVGLLTLVIGEVTPKSIAVLLAERITLAAAYPVRWIETLASPLVAVITWFSLAIVRPFGGSLSFHTSAMSEEELKIMVEQSEEYGVIEREEKEMIHNVFDFADTTAHEVMTPRLDITMVEADAEVGELVRVVTESGHSRLPVYDDEKDNIVGIVHVKDILGVITGEKAPVRIRDVMRDPFFVPDTKRVDDLLRDFRKNRTQIAIVRDEYGTTTGLVTIEDLVEEVFGDIQDEYDLEEEPMMQTVDEHTCIVDGMMDLEDFNERMGVELPSEETSSLGGFVFGLLGHQPTEGETVRWDGVEFSIEATDGKRIQKLRVVKSPPPEADGGTELPISPPPIPEPPSDQAPANP